MSLVIDSSIAISWAMPDEQSTVADDALAIASHEPVKVPSVFWNEVRNVCLVNERRGRIDADDTSVAINIIAAFGPQVDAMLPHGAVLDLARKHGLTGYDAAYLELAIRSESTLATLDKRLAAAAELEGLTVVFARS